MYSLKLSILFVALSFVLCFPRIEALACSQQYQCASVTTDYNYVQCVSGQCQCRNSNGFLGTATPSDKCRCPFGVYWGTNGPLCKKCDPPRSIIWQNGNPYCVDGAECESLTADEALQETRKQKVREIYEQLIFPTPLAIMANPELAHQFSPSVTGRVTPVGRFSDFQGVLEYFYALAATPTSRVTQVVIKTLISTGNRVGVRVDILFNRTDGSVQNLTQTGFYQFNAENQVEEFDVAILNLGAAADVPDDPVIRQGVIQQICAVTMLTPGTCLGTGEFEDFNDCVTFMNTLPFGSWNRANSNTVVCRQLHTILTPVRPLVHCPHVGKTGGGKCIDFPYEDFYSHDFL